jgi:hypothetical protein
LDGAEEEGVIVIPWPLAVGELNASRRCGKRWRNFGRDGPILEDLFLVPATK